MRRLDRAIALLLGLGLAGAAVVAGIEAMLLVLGDRSMVIPRSTWANALSTLRWGNATLLVVAGCLTAGGALLLLLQVLPRRPVRFLLREGAHAGTWLSRKGLTRKVAYDVGRLAQVGRASAKVGRRRVRVRARLEPGVDAAGGKAAVSAAALAALGQWPLRAPLRLKVRVRADDLPTTPDRPSDELPSAAGSHPTAARPA